MPEKIFWDAWAFIELGDKDARYHELALLILDELEDRRAQMVTTEAVPTEVGNAFSKQALRPLAEGQMKFVEQMRMMGRAQVVSISTELWLRGWQLFRERPDKEWGYTDCLSFVVMHDLAIGSAFTADVHFEQAGFIRLAKP